MNLPKLIKRFHDLGMRWSLFDGYPFACPGVTSILDCVSTVEMNERRVKADTTKWKAAAKAGRERGSDLHEIFNALINGQSPEVSRDYGEDVAVFKDHIAKFKIKPLLCEVSLYHPLYGYAGTVDFVGEIDGVVEIWDFKTGKSYDIKTGWQMAAYKLMVEAQCGIKVVGMRGIKVKYGELNEFEYEHIQFCVERFLAAFEAWKGLYYRYLMKYGIKDKEGGRKYVWDEKLMNTNGFLIEALKGD